MRLAVKIFLIGLILEFEPFVAALWLTSTTWGNTPQWETPPILDWSALLWTNIVWFGFLFIILILILLAGYAWPEQEEDKKT